MKLLKHQGVALSLLLSLSACITAEVEGQISEYNYCGATLDGVTDCEHRVFITETLYNNSVGGLSGMDARCNSAANSAGLQRNYVAIASDDNTDAINRIPKSGPLYVFSAPNTRHRVVSDMSLLWMGISTTLENPINYTEEYNVPSIPLSWTLSGTNNRGYRTVNNCNNWTATGGFNGVRGKGNLSGPDWIEEGPYGCTASLTLRIYCVSQ